MFRKYGGLRVDLFAPLPLRFSYFFLVRNFFLLWNFCRPAGFWYYLFGLCFQLLSFLLLPVYFISGEITLFKGFCNEAFTCTCVLAQCKRLLLTLSVGSSEVFFSFLFEIPKKKWVWKRLRFWHVECLCSDLKNKTKPKSTHKILLVGRIPRFPGFAHNSKFTEYQFSWCGWCRSQKILNPILWST